jgi:cholesterol transport system auxiliary component
MGLVRAVAPFDSTDMHYRLAFRNAAEIAAFANSRWAATPGEMLRKQILRGAGERTGGCMLDLEIQEFTQVFSAEKASEARIELRAALSRPGTHVSRGFTVSEPNAGPYAATGAGAFARAADRAIGELARWISTQPGCG